MRKNENNENLSEVPINREYKDVLFRFILTDKKVLLKLYNALNETDYDDESQLDINTLEDVIYLGYKNDLSFIIGNTMNLYEAQSTINPNMPLRGLRYMTLLYNAYIELTDDREYGSKLIKLPYPQCVVFYHGVVSENEIKILHLSDAYQEVKHAKYAPCLEFTATVININYGMNTELLAKCRELEEYSIFISKIRLNIKRKMKLKEAINLAINECINQDILRDILIKNRAEILDMMMTTFDEEKYIKVQRKEAHEEGVSEGIEIGIEIGEKRADAKWEPVVSAKDAEIAKMEAEIALLKEQLGTKD